MQQKREEGKQTISKEETVEIASVDSREKKKGGGSGGGGIRWRLLLWLWKESKTQEA